MSTETVNTAKALGLNLPADILALDALAGRLTAVQWGTANTDPGDALRVDYQSGALAKLSADDLAGRIAATISAAEAAKAARPIAAWLAGQVEADLAAALTKHADDLLAQCQPIYEAAVSAVEFATASGTTADTVPTTSDEVAQVDDLNAARETLDQVSELMSAVGKVGVARYVHTDSLAAIGILRPDGVSTYSPIGQLEMRLPAAMAKVRPHLNSDAEVAELLAADGQMLARASSAGHAMSATEHAALELEMRDA